MKRVGLCGGTFDPLHNGHVALVKAAVDSGQIDQCFVMPAGRPPHKQHQIVSPAAYRLAMVEKAFAHMPAVVVSDMEIHQKGRSYTLDTVKRLLPKLEPDSELVLIYGSDILIDLEQWHQPQDILNLCPLLLARRGGYDPLQMDRLADKMRQKFKARIDFFDCPELDVSSHAIRDDITRKKPWRHQVPEAVGRFIEYHGFYQYAGDLDRIEPAIWHQLLDYETRIWPLFTRKRLLHSLNVMLACLHLAMIHKVPLEKAGLAGLIHDCAKCLPRKEQMELAKKSGDDSMLEQDLAHAPAGMVLAREQLNVTDEDVLRAIFCHTTGCPEMSPLAMILFLCDKIEPSRHYERLQPIRDLAEKDLRQAMLLCVEEINLFLVRSKLAPHPYTLQLVAKLQSETQ